MFPRIRMFARSKRRVVQKSRFSVVSLLTPRTLAPDSLFRDSTRYQIHTHWFCASTTPLARFFSTSGISDDESPRETPQVYPDENEWDTHQDDEDLKFENFDDEKLAYDDDDYVPRQRLHTSSESSKRRIWLDPSTPLEDRVYRFLNRELGTLHHLDIALASVDLIKECGKMKSFEGMKLAHDLLDRILEEKHHVHQLVRDGRRDFPIFVPIRPFQMIMYGWSNLCRKHTIAPQRMREVLELITKEAEYDDTFRKEHNIPSHQSNEEIMSTKESTKHILLQEASCQPTVEIYITLLQGLVEASHRSIAAAGEAEQVLIAMDRMHRKRGWQTKPNRRAFTLVMNAFAKTRHRSAGDRAEAVLRKMSNVYEGEKGSVSLETGSEYNSSPDENSRPIFETPDEIAYCSVIHAHAQSDADGSAEKALSLLTELVESPSLQADAFAFAGTINAFSHRASKKMSPNSRREAAENAEDILWLMLDVLTKQMGNDGGSDTKGLAVVPFNSCLNAWAQSNVPESAARAEDLLRKMLDPAGPNRMVQPNEASFNTCIQAWAKAARDDSHAPEHAEKMLQLMAKQDGVSPDAKSYTAVMNAYAQSKIPDKAQKARRLLDKLLSDSSIRDVSAVPFTVVLNAVAHTQASTSSNPGEEEKVSVLDDAFESDTIGVEGFDDHTDPYSIALLTYDELRNDAYDLSISVDHFAAAAMLDVLRMNTDASSVERRQRVESVFRDACSVGQVSALVVQALIKSSPTGEFLQDLLQSHIDPTSLKSINGFPRAWIRNVPPKFRRMQGGIDRKGRRQDKNHSSRRKPKTQSAETSTQNLQK